MDTLQCLKEQLEQAESQVIYFKDKIRNHDDIFQQITSLLSYHSCLKDFTISNRSPTGITIHATTDSFSGDQSLPKIYNTLHWHCTQCYVTGHGTIEIRFEKNGY